tara:strand:+ start:1159 stop:1872 length:714 start_codon:yes stop_codon:yes gene_type:complete
MENKTGKYFKYAIGEIVLVVIGILIALQINNWNENNLNTKKTLTYISTLNTEIESNIVSLKIYIESTHNDLKESANTLSELHSKNAIHFNDSLLRNVMNTRPIYKPTLLKSTFTDLINSGNLEYLNDKNLKNRILSIEANIDIIYENYNLANNVWNEYQLPYLQKYGNPSGIWDSISSIKIKKLPYKRTLNAFVNNNEYANILVLRMRMMGNLESKLIEEQNRSIDLSNDIKNYLNK